LFFGIPGILILAWQGVRRNFLMLLLCTIPGFTIIVHPILLRLADNRYLVPIWPFIIVCAAYTLLAIYNKLRKAKNNYSA
jgi:hypothetical protein